MDNPLLDGFFLQDYLIEPLVGKVSGSGESVHLPSKSIEVLLCLANQPRRLVTREEILTKVWGEGHGSSENLSHAVGEIRHALGDHMDNPVFIQTVPKRGYRLLCEPQLKELPIQSGAAKTDASTPPASPFWQSLMRRGVVQATLAFLVFGWLLIQVADVTFLDLGLPAWSIPFVTYVVVGGFPLVILLAWFLESVEGRMIRDRGQYAVGLLQGLERNYLAIVAAYAIAAIGVGIYQMAVGIDVPQRDGIQIVDTDAALIPIEPNSIAMLQLLNIDGSDDTQVFSDGLSEDVLDRLATVPGLLVSSRGDAWSLPANAPSNLVRRRLRVAYFVEGSVRLVGEELRVVVQLIDSKTGFHIVSRSFDRNLQDFMAIQKEVTDLIIANLRVALPEEMQTTFITSYEDANLDAYVLYRRGKDALYKPPTEASINEGVTYFQQSLEIDPGYAAAHAGLCAAYTIAYAQTHDDSNIAAAEQACAAALAASSRLHMVHAALGRLYLQTGKTAEAEKSYLNALRINAKDVAAMQGLSAVFQNQQRFEEAEAMLVEAINLQPGNWSTINLLGNLLFETGRFADAADQYRKVVYLDPENWTTLGNLGSTLLMAGDLVGAKEALERSLAIEVNQTIFSSLGTLHYYLGEYDQSVKIHREVVELSADSSWLWLNLADAMHHAGDEEGAREIFRKSAELSRQQLLVNPSDAEAMYLLAWAEEMGGDESEATELMNRALRTAPKDLYAHYYNALIHVRRGDLAAGMAAIRSAIELGYPVQMLAAEPYLSRLHANEGFIELLAGADSTN